MVARQTVINQAADRLLRPRMRRHSIAIGVSETRTTTAMIGSRYLSIDGTFEPSA